MDYKMLRLDLFDGDGAGASAPAEGAAEATQGDSLTVPTRQNKKAGEYDNVLFGKQSAEAAVAEPPVQGDDINNVTTSSTKEDKRKAYQDLIRGEYKDQFEEHFNETFNRRFKDYKNLQTANQRMQGIIDTLSSRYGIKDGDIDKLQQSIDNDDAYWSEAAEEAGMSVDQYKQFQKLQRENESLKAAQQSAQHEDEAQRQAEDWFRQFEELKTKYDGIDPAKELDNPRFIAMLQSGVPVADAYNVMHMDEIMSGVITTATQKAEKRMADNIRARGNRPSETASASRSAFIVKDDVSKLTKEERAEVVRRALRGEQITF